MAVGAWKIYTKAKKKIGTGGLAMASNGVTLGVGIFRMALHTAAASDNILKVTIGGITLWSSIGSQIVAQGGYQSGGRTISPAAGIWTTGASNKQMKFSMTTAGLAFTASGAALSSIKYCVIRTSSGASQAGHALCFCTLSTAAFSIASPNILTILPAATGIFTLA